MAVKKQFTRSLAVQLEGEWYDRIKVIADDERCNVSMAQVVRDAIITAVPAFELQLGILHDDDEEAVAEEIRQAQQQEMPKEDRSAGCFGGPPRPE